ncbi:MAG: hypothetical protein ACI9MR_005037, partial [Myxococcota bacterium]
MGSEHLVLMFVGGMDDARVEGALRQNGAIVDKPVDPMVFPRERRRLAVLDPTAFGTTLDAALDQAVERLGDTPLLVLMGPCDRAALVTLIARPTVHAIVARDHVHGDAELQHAVTRLLEGPSYGLPCVPEAGAPTFERTLAASLEREPLLEALAEFLAESGVRRRLSALLVDATEELVTNAVYDAPTNATGERIYADVDRRHAVFLGKTSRPTVSAIVDATSAHITVADPHGSLDLPTVRRYLAKGLGGGPNQI